MEKVKSLIKSLEEAMAVSIGNPEARKMAVHTLAAKVRDFASDLAYKLADKSEPEGEMAANFPRVKQAGNRAVTALTQLVQAVYDTEKYIDVGKPVKGRLGEALRSWEDMEKEGNECASDLWDAYLELTNASEDLSVSEERMKALIGYYTGEGKVFQADMKAVVKMKSDIKRMTQDLFLMVEKIRKVLNKGPEQSDA